MQASTSTLKEIWKNSSLLRKGKQIDHPLKDYTDTNIAPPHAMEIMKYTFTHIN